MAESQLDAVRAAFFYSCYNILQCASQQPNVPCLWLYTLAHCDAQNAKYHTFMTAVMRPPFKIQSSVGHWGHLFVVPKG